VFSGRFDHSIDEKGRVSIPVRFREVLSRAGSEILFITNFVASKKKCLELYPPDEWQRLVGRIKQKGAFDPRVRTFQTFYLGGAHEVQVDRQGRILIPPKLREFAHLDREVTFSAMTDHFQLWDRRVLDKVLKEAELAFQDPKFLEGLDL
jgi:MraZ protein